MALSFVSKKSAFPKAAAAGFSETLLDESDFNAGKLARDNDKMRFSSASDHCDLNMVAPILSATAAQTIPARTIALLKQGAQMEQEIVNSLWYLAPTTNEPLQS